MLLFELLLLKLLRGIQLRTNTMNLNTELNGIWHIDDDDHDDSNNAEVDLKPVAYCSIPELNMKRQIYPTEFFKDLRLHNGILEALNQDGIIAPNENQKYLLPLFLSNEREKEDILIKAESKSGRTTAALISILNILSSPYNNLSKAIMLYPTCELANQAAQLEKRIARFTKVSSLLAIQKKVKGSGKISEQLIIGTSKKIENLIKLKQLDVKAVIAIVIDDVHLILEDNGFQNSLSQIFRGISPSCSLIIMGSAPPTKFERVLLGPLKRSYPLIVEFPMAQDNTSSIIKPYFIRCSDITTKKKYLYDIIKNRKGRLQQVVVVCESRATVNDLYDHLKYKDLPVSFITGKLAFEERESIIQKFKNGNIEVLIATRTFQDIKSHLLSTMIHFDLFRIESGNTVTLDMPAYHKWFNIMPNCKQSLVINFVDEKYADFVLKGMPAENILDKEKLAKLLLG